MATWKKIITSGSQAELKTLTLDTALPVAQGGIGASSLADKAVLISQDSGTDAVGALALTTNGAIIVGGTNGPAVEAPADVAGTGLDAATGDGTLAINVAAAQTSITSIINSSLAKIGTSRYHINIGTYSASVMITIIPVMLIFAFFQRWFIAGMTMGALKH